jgi:hypothetical protein
MNGKIREMMMKENSELSVGCQRAEDLVTYLYGEASAREAAEFEGHMGDCVSCRKEIKAFSRVRKDVVEWRNQSLPSFDSSPASAPLLSNEAGLKPSALHALREFFTLSPMWMRAATAMAVTVVCALLVFTIAYFSEQPKTVVKIVPGEPTQAQVDEKVRQRLEEIRRQERQPAVVTLPEQDSVVKNNGAGAPARVKRPAGSSQAITSRPKREMPNRATGSREARQELAELVQTQKEEDGLPRLSDLIDDANESH